jgi:hypothetical protein
MDLLEYSPKLGVGNEQFTQPCPKALACTSRSFAHPSPDGLPPRADPAALQKRLQKLYNQKSLEENAR